MNQPLLPQKTGFKCRAKLEDDTDEVALDNETNQVCFDMMDWDESTQLLKIPEEWNLAKCFNLPHFCTCTTRVTPSKYWDGNCTFPLPRNMVFNVAACVKPFLCLESNNTTQKQVVPLQTQNLESEMKVHALTENACVMVYMSTLTFLSTTAKNQICAVYINCAISFMFIFYCCSFR